MGTDASVRHVCVVGGGPAGLATAIALRQEGLAVTVLDGGTPPVDKACGEGLMPDTVAALEQLGVALPEGVGYPLRGITFLHERGTLTGHFSRSTARGLRRTVLHECLLRRALQVGVDCIWGTPGARLNSGGVTVRDRPIRAAVIVGADGQNSRIRRDAGLCAVRHEQQRYGFRQHYRIAPWSDYVQLYWGRRSQVYVTPVAQDEVGVALISGDPHLRLRQALGEFPVLEQRLAGAPTVSKEAGAVTGSRVLRNVCRGCVALVGDASGSVDAITGEGLSLAFRQAIALAQACKCGDLLSYEWRHRELRQRPHAMATLLLLLAQYNGLRRRAFATLSQHPELFERLLAIHTGDAAFQELLSWNLLSAGGRFLTA